MAYIDIMYQIENYPDGTEAFLTIGKWRLIDELLKSDIYIYDLGFYEGEDHDGCPIVGYRIGLNPQFNLEINGSTPDFISAFAKTQLALDLSDEENTIMQSIYSILYKLKIVLRTGEKYKNAIIRLTMPNDGQGWMYGYEDYTKSKTGCLDKGFTLDFSFKKEDLIPFSFETMKYVELFLETYAYVWIIYQIRHRNLSNGAREILDSIEKKEDVNG